MTTTAEQTSQIETLKAVAFDLRAVLHTTAQQRDAALLRAAAAEGEVERLHAILHNLCTHPAPRWHVARAAVEAREVS